MSEAWIAPTIGIGSTIITALIAGYFLLKGKRIERLPDPYSTADRYRFGFYGLQDAYYRLRSSFRAYAHRGQEKHPDMTLTDDERAALEYLPKDTP